MGIKSWWNKDKGTPGKSNPEAQSPAEPDLSKVFARVYMVELLFEGAPPQLDGAAILGLMESHLGKVHWAQKEDDAAKAANFLLYMLEDYQFDVQGGKMPMQMMVMKSDKGQVNAPSTSPGYAMSFHQSWRFPGAAAAVEACQGSAMVSDLMSSGIDAQARMYAFQRALWAIVKVLQPKVLHFQHSQQFLDAQTYLANEPDTPDYDPLLGILNVRMFRINDGQSGEMVMDTLGLAALGIPDLQMHFRDLDPQSVAEVLHGTGHYLFENGDVIEDGHTVAGWDESQRWRCQHEVSLVEPHRVVLDVNPGAPYAAGGRG